MQASLVYHSQDILKRNIFFSFSGVCLIPVVIYGDIYNHLDGVDTVFIYQPLIRTHQQLTGTALKIVSFPPAGTEVTRKPELVENLILKPCGSLQMREASDPSPHLAPELSCMKVLPVNVSELLDLNTPSPWS